ncbi:MAG: hypothetical protein AAFY21_05765 [Cyanobacteria bacterium J06641_2]
MNHKVAAITTGAILMLAGTASQSLAAKGFESLPQTASNKQRFLDENNNSSYKIREEIFYTTDRYNKQIKILCEYEEKNEKVVSERCYRIS